ncbi:uncharacterized protein LOC104887185 [Beta vulgaris subsp. vulgaris]|uniref:uncharacterized protein LOC104887185 n=1 Tax=Beta vulgaris subsp. vulgaris TaxID=3555 RepID=UPI002036819C|nr:uncharacterized protein LOC104887185 [Beta vulgaris subsp. vulgaris]
MFTPEKLKSAAEVFQAMASGTPPTGPPAKRPLSRAHSLVRKLRSLWMGRQGERDRHDQDQVANSKTPTEHMGDEDEEEEEAQDTKVQQHSSQPRKGSEYRRRAPVSLRTSPFSTAILQEPMEKLKMPTCKYDGKTDPEDHISAYEGHMLLYTDTDSVWCKVFPSTLVGLGQTWFKSIPPATVFDFRQLTSMFVTHFVSNKRREKTTGKLMSIKQGEKESLRDYVGRFNAEAVTIPTLQQEVAVLALMTGLREGTPFRTNAKRPAAVEKDKEKDKDKDRWDDKYWKDKKSDTTRREENNSVKKGFKGRPYKYQNYTPLTISRARIFEMHSKDDKRQRPRKMYYKGRDKSKWCEFHDDYGHKTDDCKDLKDGIEDLIRRGYFTQYQARVDRKTPPREDENTSRRPVKDRITEIHVISGGQTRGGSIDRAKASLKEVRHQVNYNNTMKWTAPPSMPSVDFTSEDAKGIINPHDDPLVVSLQISNAMVHRVLVDGGSSVNILYKETFEKMGFDKACLKPASYPVIGFTGASVVPEGTVKLAVKLGEGSRSKDLMVEFLVVDVPTAYNAIIGRLLIHDAQAVVSTYHLTMVYTSNDGKPEKIRGNQESARACYLTALKHSDHKRPADTPPLERKRRRLENKTKKDLSMENFEGRPADQPRPSPEGETEEISLEEERPERTVEIGADLADEVKLT